MTTTMWEARAIQGRAAELLDWVAARIADEAQLFTSAGDGNRVVVIDPTGAVSLALTEVPADLVARAPHAWDFEPVHRQR